MPNFSNLPPKAILVECTEKIATTAEAALYLAKSIEALFVKEGVIEEFYGLVQKFYEHAETVAAGEIEAADIWGGSKASALTMEVELTEGTHLNRGYLQDKHAPNESTVQEADRLFYEWLDKNQWTCQAGIIYEATPSGQPRLQNGEVVPVDRELVKERLLLESEGLKQYVNSEARALQMEELHVETKFSNNEEPIEGPT